MRPELSIEAARAQRSGRAAHFSFELRPAVAGDAVMIAALAGQVFLDTYAIDGVREDLAREVFARYSERAFSHRLAQPGRQFVVAHVHKALIGFAEVVVAPGPAPSAGAVGAELACLYVQPRMQRSGVGNALIRAAEQLVYGASLRTVWLTVWENNHHALAFYARMGYADVGATTYSFEGNAYANRVFARQLSAS